MRMSRDFDSQGFDKDLIRKGRADKLNDIDTLVGIADEGDRWSDEFLARVTERAKKTYMRRLLRDGFVDEDGNRVESLGIREFDPETGEPREGYKQLRFFNIDNWEYAIRDAKNDIGIMEKKFRRLCRMALGQCGNEIQQRFDFPIVFDDEGTDAHPETDLDINDLD